MKTKSIIGVLILPTAMLVASYFYMEFNRKPADLENLEPAAIVSTNKILEAFAVDEKAANKIYLGHVVEVTGLLRSTEKDQSGHLTIILADDSTPSSVRCSMDSIHMSGKYEPPIRSLVTIKGICAGYTADEIGLGADLLLNRCIVLKSR